MNDRARADVIQPGPHWERRDVFGQLFGNFGLILTVVFVFLTIVSPEQFGREWEHYHVLTILGGVILLCSLPAILNILFYAKSSRQIYLLIGFILAMGLSEVANGWFGGVIFSWGVFLPSAVVFFFIVANVTTNRGLKILALAIVAACLVLVVEAFSGYYFGFRGDTFLVSQTLFSQKVVIGELIRIRGAGFLSDPNDFAQILLIALPLTSLAWRSGRFVANLLIVYIPALFLLWAIYLTHSRGALIGLVFLVLMITREKMNATASAISGTLLCVALLAVNFTGGRMISADAGADRLSLWASGLQMFKSAPLFGVGFGKFQDFADITAHNSFILCLAELGLIGCTFWVGLLVTTMLGLNRMIRIQGESDAAVVFAGNSEQDAPAHITNAPLPDYAQHAAIVNATVHRTSSGILTASVDTSSKSEYARPSQVPTQWVLAVRLALISFITTGWFLSRTYQSTVYLVLGLATATIAMHQSAAEEPRARIPWVSYTLVVEAVAILFIYEVVRFRF